MFPTQSKITLKNKPFKYFYGQSTLSPQTISKCLGWLEKNAPWKLIETDFYEQYEFSLLDYKLPKEIDFLASPIFIGNLLVNIEEVFDIQLSKKVDVIAHKLIKGQTIRVHNDYLGEERKTETHRLLLQLSKNWKEENGGYLMFFNDPKQDQVSDIIEPVGGSIQGFEISPVSYHAVSTVHKEERFTIVYSFYKK